MSCFFCLVLFTTLGYNKGNGGNRYGTGCVISRHQCGWLSCGLAGRCGLAVRRRQPVGCPWQLSGIFGYGRRHCHGLDHLSPTDHGTFPERWPYEGRPCYVVTHRQEEDQKHISFWNGELTALVDKLKGSHEGNI